MKLPTRFDVLNARSKGFDDHETGTMPFVSNSFVNNGVVGYITPLPKEKIFRNKCICVSAFCEATVQNPPFLPRGNGGSGLTVLVPKEEMDDDELFLYATLINLQRWRFSFGRMVTGDRLSLMDFPEIPSDWRFSPSRSIASLLKKTIETSPLQSHVRR
ncbi:MAG: hypothetical protein V1735_03365 [Nanoarchaeota archaeon]